MMATKWSVFIFATVILWRMTFGTPFSITGWLSAIFTMLFFIFVAITEGRK